MIKKVLKATGILICIVLALIWCMFSMTVAFGGPIFGVWGYVIVWSPIIIGVWYEIYENL